MDDFSRDIIAFKKHHYNNIHQQKAYQNAVTNMKATEAVIICDFSENYQSKLTEEIQSSKFQISLHTGMIYLKNRSQSFCTISDNLTHQPPAIWAHLTPILHTVKEMDSASIRRQSFLLWTIRPQDVSFLRDSSTGWFTFVCFDFRTFQL
ncbi:hypothetical protein PYW08_006029 [Mythimna loreyi]|uniref:Uncharacterized protein n=1 Tax=Mythimna loreyi TaxID=667449 RepID=A0ACC2QLG5_9NEOP|nr:hypothetical protein PYW08_006029 [Mythimna loreyi]